MLRTTLLLALLLTAASARSAVFCVGNSTEFADALTAASTNGEGDEIRLLAGDYLPPTEIGFNIALIQNAESLQISGGWFNFQQLGCIGQNGDPRLSRIVGNQTHRLLRTTASPDVQLGNITLSNMSFSAGRGPDNQNIGAVHLGLIPSAIRILIDRVQFNGNSGYSGAAITALGMQELTIRNSLFMFNEVRSQQGAIFVSLTRDDQRFFFVNNTVIDNVHSGSQATRCSGLYLSTPQETPSPDMLIANSIFWGNEDFDLCLSPEGDSYLLNNNIQDQFRSATVESGNLSVAPMLAPQILDITPLPGSPMIDAGRPQPGLFDQGDPIDQSWSHGDHGFNNLITPRVVGQRVDIGAAESTFVDRVFCDGFQLEGGCPGQP
ncbi:hypothetical protein [Wenzhouxiangella marina]|uniref:Uncharacterized protein n=1 Tax=Wenzhouxiangella marina TaxID=1579979 RepID=A0A0K0XZA4_9GAMM|nr:hypothetical protein [Wenzhouxiangella marina]AKS42951.1 hypothetical protein WM2015_2593 [Wenzhouxiangella marina]MBB6087365.1 hypothetical protein [Wenzhouxiangella marina]